MPRCKLCGATLPGARSRTRCSCGWRLDDRCHEAHGDWCPDGGRDAWIGAVEF
ncbi:hypothetical protein [Halomicrobium urmianum]|uniref:hypothetical protein n=1 Tax=Halomicrobium urmianum TaxID=1586233 RepID=UPI001CD92758|nr:hypothetical protein [Halomicrobium urmianum]